MFMSSYPTRKETNLIERGCDPAPFLTEQDDVLFVIFDLLDLPTLLRIQRVCSYWKVLIHKAIPRRLGNKMFLTTEELDDEIEKYCSDKVKYADELASTYGWPIGKWNVSKVSNFSNVFQDQLDFNEDISEWDISNAINLSCMFHGASSFNQDLKRWDVSKVKYMDNMFRDATSFNGDISTWNTSKVVTMGGMFDSAYSFNRDLSRWNTSRVKNMFRMFSNASSFNGDISKWNTSEVVVFMALMFRNARSFNQDISSWNVSNIEYWSHDHSGTFAGAISFNNEFSPRLPHLDNSDSSDDE